MPEQGDEGTPHEAFPGREIGARRRHDEGDSSTSGSVIPGSASSRGRIETCTASFVGPADIVRLFRAVLCTVRRRIGEHSGRLPSRGDALEAMLGHAFESWGADARVPARHAVFARDGWRCSVPGCTSMQNLHDHHIRFRSAGGSDAPHNRITLCAFHHLRGVHGGLLGCIGRAPDGVMWQMGLRPGVTPRFLFRAGEIRAAAR
jgi:hypothetical protein